MVDFLYSYTLYIVLLLKAKTLFGPKYQNTEFSDLSIHGIMKTFLLKLSLFLSILKERHESMKETFAVQTGFARAKRVQTSPRQTGFAYIHCY